jgi:hypothetical protein
MSSTVLVDFTGAGYQYGTSINFLTTQSARVQFVDAAGDSMTGDLNMGNNKIKNVPDPIDIKDAVNRAYLDQKLSEKLDKNMNGNKITNLGTPTDNRDSVNKEYVDNLVKGIQDMTSSIKIFQGTLPADKIIRVTGL